MHEKSQLLGAGGLLSLCPLLAWLWSVDLHCVTCLVSESLLSPCSYEACTWLPVRV
jgi:hypothetical protein